LPLKYYPLTGSVNTVAVSAVLYRYFSVNSDRKIDSTILNAREFTQIEKKIIFTTLGNDRTNAMIFYVTVNKFA
jgi:hypothetical protein